MMRTTVFFLLLIQLLYSTAAFSEEEYQKVKVADPFIELHSGPGGGYPIFHVIERGQWVDVMLRRTSWFKIRDDQGHEGWASIEQMELTLTPEDERVNFKRYTSEDFVQRKWEVGVMGGEFGGAAEFTVYGAYLLNQGMAAEVGYAEAIGTASSSQMLKLGLLMQPFSSWTVSPYFYLGTGIINVDPNATLVIPKNRDNQFSNIAFGVRAHLSRRIIIRAEYGEYVIFSADSNFDDNEDIKEWKLGFAVFF